MVTLLSITGKNHIILDTIKNIKSGGWVLYNIKFISNKSEIKYYDNLKDEILSMAIPLNEVTVGGHRVYAIKEQEDVLNFYKDKFTYRDIGYVYFYFWDNAKPNNGMQFYTMENMWQYVNIDYFYNTLFNTQQLKYIIHSKTTFETPKITKPKELRGIKQVFSIPFMGNKGKCAVFIKGDDVWVKHTDYFSPFVRVKDSYIQNSKGCCMGGDDWKYVLLKTQAWLEVKNLYKLIKYDTLPSDLSKEVLRLLAVEEDFKLIELVNTHMSRFWENVIAELHKYKYCEEDY